MKHLDIKLLQIFIFVIPFAFGLFYEFTSYFAQVFLLLILALLVIKRKKIRIYLNFSNISLLAISLGYLFSIFYARDTGMAFLGFLKFTVPLTFAIILMQYKENHIRKIFNVIPCTGILMIILSIIFKYIPILPDYFYLPNGRMAGFFQYSNSFALFLLIGIICLVNSKAKKINIILGTAVLLVGVFATGSRLIFLLTILSFIIFIVKQKSLRKYLAGLVCIAILLTFMYAIITNNFNTFGRYLTTSLNSSTLLERLLYYKDAILILLKFPFGLGYMGYSYIQTSIQTGMYSTLYVHNEFLQIALDIGIIPMIIFIIAIVKNLISKGKLTAKKQILLTVVIHMLFDFDLQFLSIFLILIMTLNTCYGKRYILKVNRKILIISVLLIQIVYLYFGICTFLQYINKSDISIIMYPIYTEANLNVINENANDNLKYANEIATKVLETNTNVALPYKVKSIYDLENNNWQQMIKNKQKSLEINKYDITNCEEYIIMLSQAIDYYAKNDDMNKVYKCIDLILQIPSQIENLKNSTSGIAYKINDVPNFKFSTEIENYIEKMKGVSKK